MTNQLVTKDDYDKLISRYSTKFAMPTEEYTLQHQPDTQHLPESGGATYRESFNEREHNQSYWKRNYDDAWGKLTKMYNEVGGLQAKVDLLQARLDRLSGPIRKKGYLFKISHYNGDDLIVIRERAASKELAAKHGAQRLGVPVYQVSVNEVEE